MRGSWNAQLYGPLLDLYTTGAKAGTDFLFDKSEWNLAQILQYYGCPRYVLNLLLRYRSVERAMGASNTAGYLLGRERNHNLVYWRRKHRPVRCKCVPGSLPTRIQY